MNVYRFTSEAKSLGQSLALQLKSRMPQVDENSVIFFALDFLTCFHAVWMCGSLFIQMHTMLTSAYLGILKTHVEYNFESEHCKKDNTVIITVSFALSEESNNRLPIFLREELKAG